MYGGAFQSGTALSLSDDTDGMENFGGNSVTICKGITPNGCINSLRDAGEKSIIFFSDEDIERATTNMITIEIK